MNINIWGGREDHAVVHARVCVEGEGFRRYTLHSTLCILHPIPHTLHPTLYTPHPTPCTLHPAPYTLQPTPYTQPPSPRPLNLEVSGRWRTCSSCPQPSSTPYTQTPEP